ncbi:tRNA (N6-isopentenyl adenosine(37)-C2)-methylthiotransferase MiaB [Acidithiobacillus sp. CV18-2]|uniref:tRNA-2-methylthio-N(6)-dimethylallyladenosine synthase n=1 Tax=Igneacidithiobacillus copahuensis TaxID=2724909 RepID=A0AAE2YPM5_9PROT|nr:tRNA (N6-isopentenyl adenosine(37)-C2)-methylthiotransferase MiaB [Igneacidithiobacillus copahuensis]MBU2753608.1 tRNA (N6-isopentenyl adenosine(37)-C2)-methylthiotransferase MiaB [Acidithiobacillus sp. CV18-3]MBU2758540.1 tRNA (N6-isopentenyl adenosine(37)-C2)-methylthiotransferase MiaB [Acidithiobacillus sp. BN09-2]MBU2776326.1 tRNA (N6-isopentenyl adenosine(37)-C2)-methylthiotransferase MiaB [Acidithiobacillus sp. CV18-2]MBU2795242.1 tRNA (N6-isopentenyl adenosine(37)-C2)-methylthiotransf
MRHLYIKTFGCQMNEYDSERMAELLARSHGMELVETPEEADLLILNTCSIREKAEDKVYTQLGFWRPLKERDPQPLIAVGGCVASQEGERLRRRAPFVDIVFGPQTLHRLPDLLDARLAERQPQLDLSFPELEKFDRLPERPGRQGATAFVTVQEGCDKFCTFCVVPHTRGREYSRPLPEIVREVRQLLDQGVAEITLLGQNVNAYRAPSGLIGDADFADLLRRLALLPGLQRLRYTTSHPNNLGERLIAAHRDLPVLAPHLHLPVQSGSDRILRRMHRKHSIAEYLEKVAALREARPEIRFSSDFIVGFPGETDADFQATMDLIDQVRFDQSFSFKYSPRPNTPALKLKDSVPEPVKEERLAILQTRINQLAQDYSRALVGSTQNVLVTGPSRRDPNEWTGKTGCNRSVNFAGPKGLAGQMLAVEITEALPNSLRGRLTAMRAAS